VAESGDPFATLRVIHLVARMERGRPVRLADLAARLEAEHLDWLFPERTVADVLIQLQVDWMTDYRNGTGIVLGDGDYGATVTLEDSTRVDPWIVERARRAVTACHERLAEFSRRDHVAAG
jgi:hypothetical protein